MSKESEIIEAIRRVKSHLDGKFTNYCKLLVTFLLEPGKIRTEHFQVQVRKLFPSGTIKLHTDLVSLLMDGNNILKPTPKSESSRFGDKRCQSSSEAAGCNKRTRFCIKNEEEFEDENLPFLLPERTVDTPINLDPFVPRFPSQQYKERPELFNWMEKQSAIRKEKMEAGQSEAAHLQVDVFRNDFSKIDLWEFECMDRSVFEDGLLGVNIFGTGIFSRGMFRGGTFGTEVRGTNLFSFGSLEKRMLYSWLWKPVVGDVEFSQQGPQDPRSAELKQVKPLEPKPVDRLLTLTRPFDNLIALLTMEHELLPSSDVGDFIHCAVEAHLKTIIKAMINTQHKTTLNFSLGPDHGVNVFTCSTKKLQHFVKKEPHSIYRRKISGSPKVLWKCTYKALGQPTLGLNSPEPTFDTVCDTFKNISGKGSLHAPGKHSGSDELTIMENDILLRKDPHLKKTFKREDLKRNLTPRKRFRTASSLLMSKKQKSINLFPAVPEVKPQSLNMWDLHHALQIHRDAIPRSTAVMERVIAALHHPTREEIKQRFAYHRARDQMRHLQHGKENKGEQQGILADRRSLFV